MCSSFLTVSTFPFPALNQADWGSLVNTSPSSLSLTSCSFYSPLNRTRLRIVLAVSPRSRTVRADSTPDENGELEDEEALLCVGPHWETFVVLSVCSCLCGRVHVCCSGGASEVTCECNQVHHANFMDVVFWRTEPALLLCSDLRLIHDCNIENLQVVLSTAE